MQQLLFAPFNKKGKPPNEHGQYEYPRVRQFRVENLIGHIRDGSAKALKYRDMDIAGFGLKPISFTASGMPQCDTPVIKKLAGDAPSKGKYGLAYEHFKAIDQE